MKVSLKKMLANENFMPLWVNRHVSFVGVCNPTLVSDASNQ